MKKNQNDRPQAALLTIGDELLKGSTLNTNARFLGKELTELGFVVREQIACRDDIRQIKVKLREVLAASQVLIVTGGLGPTPDDLTRDAIAEYFGVPLEFSKLQYQRIKKLYQQFGKRVPDIVKKEAMFPRNALPLINRHGIALGFYMLESKRLMIVLPGVPSELQKMFEELGKPLIRKIFPGIQTRNRLTIKTVGLSEPEIMKRLGKDFFRDPFDFGIYPDTGEVAIRLFAENPRILSRLKKLAAKRLKEDAYAFQDVSLANEIGRLLTKKGKTLSVSESCTGGLLAGEITSVAGSSRYFLGGVVTYQNQMKKSWLGVTNQDLSRFGAVSEKVARALALGIAQKTDSDFSISITGIAGPGGGTIKKPVGLVFIALARGKSCKVYRHQFWGDRERVRARSVKKALEYLWRVLKS